MRRPHSNGLCSLFSEGSDPGSAQRHVNAGSSIQTLTYTPSSVVKCLCEVFVRGVVLVVCVCVSVSGVLFSVGVCVCDQLIFLHSARRHSAAVLLAASMSFVFASGYKTPNCVWVAGVLTPSGCVNWVQL